MHPGAHYRRFLALPQGPLQPAVHFVSLLSLRLRRAMGCPMARLVAEETQVLLHVAAVICGAHAWLALSRASGCAAGCAGCARAGPSPVPWV
jgi:hypothetical protein